MLGYLLAFTGSLFFSFYTIPRKFSKLRPLDYSFLMACGFFVSSTVLLLLQPVLNFHERLSPILFWTILAGAIWAAAFVIFIKAIDAIGLSRSNQWKNLQGPAAAVISLIALGEYQSTRPVFVVFAGVAVFISAVCFTISSSRSEAKANLAGVYLAALSGLGFGITAVIQKHVTTHGLVYTQQVVFSLFIAISIGLYILSTHNHLPSFKLSEFDKRLAFGAGILYLGASFFQLQSYRHLPASIAFTIIQLNTVWTIGIGILYFKEISIKKHYRRLSLGLFFAILGIIILSLAKK